MAFDTIPQMFLKVVNQYAGNTSKYAYMRKSGGKYTGISYDKLRTMVESFALGLLEMGLNPGDRMGIISENRLEWVVADFAATGIGVIDVPVFPTLTPRQIEYVYNDCDASCIIVSNAFQLNKILKIESELRNLKHIIVMNDDVNSSNPLVKSFQKVIAIGEAAFPLAVRRDKFEKYCQRIRPDDFLTIIYTSGTTGSPKGVLLTHSNLISNIQGALDAIQLRSDDLLLSYLPLCHAYERMAGYYTAFSVGATTAFAESIETVAENLREVRPTVATSVPRLFEKIKHRVYTNAERESATKQKIFHWAIGVGRDYVRGVQKKKISLLLRLSYALADKLVYGKIRERTGGRLRMFVSGGAALPAETGEFFQMIGIPVIEGYGMTEASPVISANRMDEIEFGTVGRPLSNVELEIAEDGEILARGPNIMKGYWRDEEATREVIDSQGWLHTGDIGHFNSKGHLVITDRKKHIFVSSGGKNISPQPIEQLLSQSKYIDQIVLIGDKREYCTALIVPEFENLRKFAAEKGLIYNGENGLVEDTAVYRLFQEELDRLQSDLAKYERVRKFTILSTPFSVENGDMTPTLKIKRKVVEQKYEHLIDLMYEIMEQR